MLLRTLFPFFKGLCLGLRAYAERLEALRALGSRKLKGPERGESRNLSPASSMQSLMEFYGISLRNEAPNKFCDR